MANRVTAAGPALDVGWATRTRKICEQLWADVKENPSSESVAGTRPAQKGSSTSATLFRSCSVYVNGYTGAQIGNKELMRLLTLHGAEVHMLLVGGTTHIVSSMQLSAKKREEMIRLKAGRVKKFVKIEW